MSKLIRRSRETLTARPLDHQEVRLKPAPIWSQMMVWSITATAVPGFGFAVMAKIGEVVVAPGTLQPRGAERSIKSSLAGVVGQILVEEGQRVPRASPYCGLIMMFRRSVNRP